MIRKTPQERVKDLLLGAAGFGIVAMLWELVKRVGDGKRILGINTSDSTMPHVSDVARAFSKEAIQGQGKSVFSVVLHASWFTFRLAVGGFVLGICLGLLLAMVMQRFRIVERAWLPYVVLSQTVPLIALAPLISGWGGNIRLFGYQWTGWMSVVGMAAYLSFFPITIGALRGFKSPKGHSVELMNSYAASWWQMLVKLRLPASVPYLVPSLKLAAAASIVGSIVSEASIGVSGGIGRLIIDFTSGEPAKVFTAFIGAAALGLVVAGLVALAERFLTRNLNASNQSGASA